MRMVGVPFRYLRVLGNLLAIILSSRVAPPYITMAVSGFQGSSNSVAISAAIEPMVIAEIIDATAEMIAPYVKKDPTAFYSYQEFESGIDTLRAFCLLREESVEGQINGTISATTSGQAEDSSALIDASSITLSDMGSMGGSGGGGFKPNSDQSRGPGAAPAGNTNP